MPIQTDAPTGIGAEQDWQIGAGASKVDAVLTNDGDTTFIYASSGGRVNSILYTFPQLVGIADPVTSALIAAHARKHINGTGGQSFFFKWDSAVAGGNVWSALPTDYTYATPSYAAGAATVAACNGQHGFYMSAAGGPEGGAEIWVTQVFRQVVTTYTAIDSTGFNFLVGGILASIGANLLMRDMGGVVRALKAKGRLILPHEIPETYRRLRAMTFPKHFVLAKE